MVFLDESGFSRVSPLKRTWAPRGHTPTIRTSIDHHQRINLLGAVCLSPAGRRLCLRVRSFWRTLRGEEVIIFLTQLLAAIRGPIVLVWDQHPIHKRRAVQAFLESHPRIHLYTLPTGAPELNPSEYVWTQISEYTASTAPRTAAELGQYVRAGIARTRRSQSRLQACLTASGLPW